MPDSKDQLPVAKIPAAGIITVSLSSKKAKHGIDLIAQIRSLNLSFPRLAEAAGVRLPPDLAVESAKQVIEDLTAALVWMRLTRQLRSAGYDLFALLVQSANVPIMDMPPEGTNDEVDG